MAIKKIISKKVFYFDPIFWLYIIKFGSNQKLMTKYVEFGSKAQFNNWPN